MMLISTESRICELYLEGKTAQEITVILGIQENTTKYHNKTISPMLAKLIGMEFDYRPEP